MNPFNYVPRKQQPSLATRKHLRHTLLGFSVTLLLTSTVGVLSCGAHSDTQQQGTETGNPPWIDRERIEVLARDGEVLVIGQPGAVPDGASVRVENTTTGDHVTVEADDDGAFEAPLEGSVDDDFNVEVDGDTLQLGTGDVETTDNANDDDDDDVEATDVEVTDGGESVPPDGGGATPSDDPSPPDDECRGPGHYEAGKEGSYQPCCEGLTEVLQLKAGYDGDDKMVCADAPLRVYACVAGECGDGSCEVGEDVPCGCAEDCPNAAWGPPQCAPIAQQTDELLTELHDGLDTTCEEHTDCTRVGITTECAVGRCSGQQAPVSRSDLERAQRELESITALCDAEHASACDDSRVQCEPEEPWLSQCDAGACERLYGCEEIAGMVEAAIAVRAEQLDRSCSVAEDCTFVSTHTSCGNFCGVAPVALADETGRAEFQQWLATFERDVCGDEFAASGCESAGQWVCPGAPLLNCVEGRCE